MSIDVTVEGGKSVLLPTAGKYCDQDIVITATGGGEGSSGIYMAQITPAEDTNEIVIEHNLNCDVRAAFLYADELTVDAEAIGNPVPVLNVYIKTGLDVQITTSTSANAFTAVSSYVDSIKAANRPFGATSGAYLPLIKDTNTLAFLVANIASLRFKAGQTLNVIVIAGV